MKKFLALMLCFALGITLFVACGGTGGTLPEDDEEEIVVPYTPDPFTGQKKPDDYPNGERPIAIMINNLHASLPQSGISFADITYEIVTEAGITRLMCMYSNYSKLQGVAVGPVRSARDQHVQLMLPINAIYMHIGGSSYARTMLDEYGYANREIDGNYAYIESLAFFRDKQRFNSGYAWEHCAFTTGELIAAGIEELELLAEGEPESPIFNFVHYDDAPRQLMGGLATHIQWDFSDYETAALQYDETLNQYLKYEFGAAQIDNVTGLQLGYTNALVLFTSMTFYPDNYLTKVDYAFGGYGFYFYGGRYEQVRWVKGTPTQPLRIVDVEGNEIDVQLNVGNTYIAIVDYSHYDKFLASFESEGPVPGTETQSTSADASTDTSVG